jgi:cytoskeletal protein CcmA (bactofilin family)
MERQDDILHSLLGAGTRYEGKLFFDGRARIDGDFEGEVISDGLLVIGPEATLQGVIRVNTLIVQGGLVHGDIHATELVELHAPARIRGDIRTRALYIDRGVLFDGACVMGQVLELQGAPNGGRSAQDVSADGYKDQPSKN